MKFIFGKKIEMSQIFKDNGEVVPVTKISVDPCVITQIKTVAKDGYSSIQLGSCKVKGLNKPQKGHLKDLADFSVLKEYRVDEAEAGKMKKGSVITAEIFQSGEMVTVEGISKGKGFAGVVKRHGFHGQNTSHGTKDQVRMPGTAGPGGVQRVFKGVKKPGRMGTDQITIKNLEIVKFDPTTNILYIKGAVPGARHSVVSIYNDAQITTPLSEFNAKPVIESAPVEAAPVATEPVVESNPAPETPVASEQPVANNESEKVTA